MTAAWDGTLVQYLTARGIAGHVEQLDGGDRLHGLVVGKRPDNLFLPRDFDDVRGSA